MEIVEAVLARQLPAGAFPDASSDFGLEDMANTEFADQVVFYIDSTLDQAVTAQIIGHRRNEPRNLSQAVTVGGSISVAAGSSTPQNDTMGIALNDGNWHRWLGIMITTGATAPTAGRLTVTAAVRMLMGRNGREERAGVSLETTGLQQLGQYMQELARSQRELEESIRQLLARTSIPGRGR